MTTPRSPLRAPKLLGAFFFATGLLFSGCEKEVAADWPGESIKAAAERPPETASTESEGDAEPASSGEVSGDSVRFISYNVENWLTMDRYVDGERQDSNPKPEKEKKAAITVLARHEPDVLGLCEIGTEEDLADLQSRLADAGIDLPHSHHTGGFDDTRRLALLSRYPIVSRELHEDLEYELEGRTMGMGRGILDVTLDTPVGELRFLGAHLKSKREIPEADQEMMRRAEAHLLRDQADRVLKEAPGTQLIVHGDFNDMRQASAIRTLRGPSDGPLSLKMAWLKDSRGHTWTHHWSYQDVYSRFDYVLFSPPVLDIAVWDQCRVLDDPEVLDASDHRPLLFVMRPGGEDGE